MWKKTPKHKVIRFKTFPFLYYLKIKSCRNALKWYLWKNCGKAFYNGNKHMHKIEINFHIASSKILELVSMFRIENFSLNSHTAQKSALLQKHNV